MKRFFALCALTLSALTINAQTMKVIKTDGTAFEFNTEEIQSVQFLEGPGANTENGYEYVDLGLPSGTMWAKCNVGATKAEDAGNYYSWGEITPKDNYTSQTYLWGTASGTDEDGYDQLTALTKYNTNLSYGAPDYKMELDLDDDAAAQNMGGAWRMPTYDDMDELLSLCYCQITKVNGVRGMKFTGPNGNYIFLPCVGLRYGEITMFNDVAMQFGFYWTSSLGSDAQFGRYLYSEGGQNKHGESFRFYGQSVRAVFRK